MNDAQIAQRFTDLEQRIAQLEATVERLTAALNPAPKQRNARLTRWMND